MQRRELLVAIAHRQRLRNQIMRSFNLERDRTQTGFHFC
jgi:hypothetical protein